MFSLLVAVALSGAVQVAPDVPADPTVSMPQTERVEPPASPEAPVEEGLLDLKSSEWKLHDQTTLSFMRIDRDGDDIVTERELRSYYTVLHSRSDLSRDRVRGIVKKSVGTYIRIFDADGSGDVSFAEVVDGGMLRDRTLERSSQTFS